MPSSGHSSSFPYTLAQIFDALINGNRLFIALYVGEDMDIVGVLVVVPEARKRRHHDIADLLEIVQHL